MIVTVSDSIFDDDRPDTSGQAIRDWSIARGDVVVAHERAADDTSVIAPLLAMWGDSGDADVIFTTGGTGLAPRDVTPEATRSVIEREANGIAEYLRASSFERFPHAALSRGVAGVRGSTLIVNLPGSPGGVKDFLDAIGGIIDHAVDIVTGKATRNHPAAGGGGG